MHNFDLDNSPVIESFGCLHRRENVYSRKYGLGYVYSFYNNEVIIQFSNLRKRFSVDDKEIRKIPDKYFKKPNAKIEISISGKKVSYGEYKKRRGLTRKKIREEKEKHLSVKQALKILNVNKEVFFETINAIGIKTKQFGKSQMIRRDDLMKLVKKLNSS